MNKKIFITCNILLTLLSTFHLPLLAQDNAKLIEYIMYQEFDKAKELINNGADVNYQDESTGSTALMLACQYNFADMVSFLVEHGADLNLQADNGTTALMAAAGTSEDLFDLLLSKGADLKIKAGDGTTALTQACIGVISENVPLTVVQKILEKGADPNEAPASGYAESYTCLMMAARNDQPELVKLLVSKGADVNKKAKDGKSALDLAKEENNEEMVTLLKSLGAEE